MKERIRNNQVLAKLMPADEAAMMIKDGMTVATSGFTPSGYPKAIPLALNNRVSQSGEPMSLTLLTGASVGNELDGVLARSNIITRRYPYQTDSSLRNNINNGTCQYSDMHLSLFPQWVKYGFLGKLDVAIIEAAAITEEGNIIPSTSIGASPTFVEMADKVLIEVNTSQPMELEGMADIYTLNNPPFRKPIPITSPADRIGTPYISCPADKIAAVVITDIPDGVRPLAPIDDTSKKIAHHLMDFLRREIKAGRLPKNLLPLQSGVGSVANAVLGGLLDSEFTNLSCYTEVLQDAMLDLIDAGKIVAISTGALTPSLEGLKRFKTNLKAYRDKIIFRPQEISNNPEVIRRLGVISCNTAIEVDIYGNVNSTNIMGSMMMNGIGGSGDFARNAYISIFTTPSTARQGTISSIVPMVAHVDHTEHDVMVVVTEQGYADLRGLSPRERAKVLIDKCAHPDYKPWLRDYLDRASREKYKHTPHLLKESLAWHVNFMERGTMKPRPEY
ncbi:MAG: acetyl-CoA hydrolase/transferase family protein [Syntrophomonadaceae bacterium]|jgi:succinyl-CoA:acetate CoA-transferase